MCWDTPISATTRPEGRACQAQPAQRHLPLLSGHLPLRARGQGYLAGLPGVPTAPAVPLDQHSWQSQHTGGGRAHRPAVWAPAGRPDPGLGPGCLLWAVVSSPFSLAEPMASSCPSPSQAASDHITPPIQYVMLVSVAQPPRKVNRPGHCGPSPHWPGHSIRNPCTPGVSQALPVHSTPSFKQLLIVPKDLDRR